MDHDLLDILERGRSAEIQRGQTLVGPHRADLMIVCAGAPARLSRGQAKVVVCLLQLAAERVHRGAGLAPSLWLLDDIDAELDNTTAKRLWELFENLDAQRFVTRLMSEPVGIADQHAMFHVEHGMLSTIGI
jgi:DNA replication and repair protein RecF